MCTITIKRDKGRKERNNLEENKRTNIPVFAEVLLIRRDRWLNLSRPKARLYGGIRGGEGGGEGGDGEEGGIDGGNGIEGKKTKL